MRKWFLAICAGLVLGACASESVVSTQNEVARAAYRHDGPPRLTLFTMINNRSGAGAHSALMVNGMQRVIFDPAGTFNNDLILPERNDVLFGITPKVADVYTRYHARETFHVKVQTLDVPPETARRAEQAVMAYGAVPNAQCALSTSRILQGIFPGRFKRTWFPRRLAEDFGKLPGVSGRALYEYDSADNSRALADWDPDLVARDAGLAY